MVLGVLVGFSMLCGREAGGVTCSVVSRGTDDVRGAGGTTCWQSHVLVRQWMVFRSAGSTTCDVGMVAGGIAYGAGRVVGNVTCWQGGVRAFWGVSVLYLFY